MAYLQLTLFGGFQAQLTPGPILQLPAKTEALLAYLAVSPTQEHPRDKLAALLWSNAPEGRARDSLRHAISTLRAKLPINDPATLVTQGHTVALRSDEIGTDVLTFEQLVSRNTPETLEQASGLYQGPLLEGLSLNEEGFEEWLLSERERLWELALEALTRLLAHYSKADLTQEATRTAKRLLTLDPLQEAVHRLLMRLYVRRGRRHAALRQYQLCVAILQRELGIDPEAETKTLYQDILQRRLLAPALNNVPLATETAGPSPAPALNIPSYNTPFIGRELEQARLCKALEVTEKGQGQSFLVFGESGIGKSYLIGTIALEAYRHNSCVLIGRCYENEQVLSLAPWVNALRNGGGRVTAAFEHLSPLYRQELSTILPEALQPGGPSAAVNEEYHRLFESVAQLIRILSNTSAVVLILEDLHWADDKTLELMAFLSRRIKTARVLFIGTAQEEELESAPKLRHITQDLEHEDRLSSMRLSSLSRAETAKLVKGLARVGINEDVLDRLAEQVWAISEGNPFLAVEMMRNLQEEKASSTLDLRNAPMPQRVRDLLVRRLERLNKQAQLLVAAAAVIGHEFDFQLLHCVTGLTEAEIARDLEELVRRRIFHCVAEKFDFTHDRLRQAALNRTLSPQRNLLQRDLEKALKLLAPELAPSKVEDFHYQQR